MTRLRALLASLASTACLLGVGAACSSFRTTDNGQDGGGSGADADSDATTRGAEDSGVPSDAASDGSLEADAFESGSSDYSGDDGGLVCTQTTCTVSTIISHLYGPAALAVDTTYLYWLEVGTGIPQADTSGEFVRMPKDTTCTDRSCVEVLDPFALSGTFEDELIYDNLIAVNATQACYSQSFNAQSEHAISCFPLSSLTKTSIDQDYGDCDNLWAGPDSMLWTLASTTATSSDGSVRVHSFAAGDGGPAPSVASGRPDPTSVIADGTGVIWTETGLDAGGSVLVAESDGGTLPLALERGGPAAVTEYGGYVYWLDAAARTVSRTTRAGGTAVQQIANTDVGPFALVVDATGVYWAATGLTAQEGSVGHAPLVPGGPTTVMLSSVDNIEALAVDTTRVFVAALGATVNGGGSIVAIDKVH
jgi:hypothetical protein